MLEEIEIQNFRCFEETKISGFERVNLIGGKNNSGKTALLEALYLFNAPLPQGILFLMQLRKDSLSFSKAFPEKTWDNFFFRGRKDKSLEIRSRSHLQINKKLIISYQQQNLSGYTLNNLVEFPDNSKTISKIISTSLNCVVDYIDSERNIALQDILGSIIADSQGFSVKEDKNRQEYYGYVRKYEDETVIPNKKDMAKLRNELINFDLDNTIFLLPSNQRSSSQELAVRYDQSVLNNQASEILNIIKIIDPSIEEIRTLSLGEPQIYLRRKGEDLLPISLFGDALNRIIEIVINLIDVQNGILLIDEIENGIHYLNQREFWLNLFKLSKVLEVQIFATTHSLEMIKAFADVGLNEYPEEAAYIELARHPKTNQIIGIKRDMETLDYALEHEKGVGLRGE